MHHSWRHFVEYEAWAKCPSGVRVKVAITPAAVVLPGVILRLTMMKLLAKTAIAFILLAAA